MRQARTRVARERIYPRLMRLHRSGPGPFEGSRMMASQGKKIWIDGKMLEFADAKVHVLAHTLLGYTTPVSSS